MKEFCDAWNSHVVSTTGWRPSHAYREVLLAEGRYRPRPLPGIQREEPLALNEEQPAAEEEAPAAAAEAAFLLHAENADNLPRWAVRFEEYCNAVRARHPSLSILTADVFEEAAAQLRELWDRRE